MSVLTITLITIAGTLILLALGVPIVYTLGISALVGGVIAWGPDFFVKVGWMPFQIFYNLTWTPLPLFVLLGCIISSTRISDDVFVVTKNWLSRLPGGLIIASIVAEAAMAAVVGTSTACIITVGKVAVPQMEKMGYNRAISMGALCAAGVLGPLIPPSAMMIIYAIMSQISLGKLFIAGIIPGIVLAALLSIYTIIACLVNPKLAPRPISISWKERISSAPKIWPIVFMMLAILGSIYMGIVTPTEAAGFGVVVILILGFSLYGLRLPGLFSAATEAASINVMICFIFIAATIFSFVIGSSGVAKTLINLIAPAGMSPWLVMISINILLLLLGCFIDALTIMLLTLPILVPLIISLGFDPLWFGVVFVINMQIGLITPPMGMDLFSMNAVFGVPTGELLRGVVPYLGVLVVFLAVVIIFPQISVWLPNLMK